MIIACPSCTTRYAVPDSAIGSEGRLVRCAKCGESWFQDAAELPPRAEAAAPAPAVAPPQAAPAPSTARDQPDDTRSAVWERPAAPAVPPPAPPRPRRRRVPLRWRMMAPLGFAMVTLAAVALVALYGLPAWVPFGAGARFADGQAGLTLDFPPNRQDRRTLPDGTEYFGVSGTITNVDTERRSVPAILILLRNDSDRVVYSWIVTPPKRELAPGEAESIIEAVTDIPRSAKTAEIGWKPG